MKSSFVVVDISKEFLWEEDKQSKKHSIVYAVSISSSSDQTEINAYIKTGGKHLFVTVAHFLVFTNLISITPTGSIQLYFG